MLPSQGVWLRYWFFSGMQAEGTVSCSLLPERNGCFIKLSKLKLIVE